MSNFKYEIEDEVILDEFLSKDPARKVKIGFNTWAEAKQNCNTLAEELAAEFGVEKSRIKFKHTIFKDGLFWPFPFRG